MSKMKVKEWLKALKHIVTERRTIYQNRYPYNCGYIWPSGYLSFDCIGLVKSTINNIEIAYKTHPAGYFVKPGQIIPDTTESGILGLCTDVKWGSFERLVPGEYLYMEGHAGIYVGDLFGKDSRVNVIECTAAWGGGVVASWVDPDGTRRSWKPGQALGKWEAHGKLSRYIDYDKTPKKKKSVTAIAKEVIDGKWGNYPERKKKLEKAGYDYEKVQKKVNALLTTKK